MLTHVALQGEDADVWLNGHAGPIGCGSPAALGEAVRCREVGDVDADHGLAEAT
jgi:thiamine pyrophosphate-dependent acetolactate synthase large subunit-like protein